MRLRDYQQQAIDSVLSFHSNGVSRQLVVLPTGTGKTVVLSGLISQYQSDRDILILAHREELLTQAQDKVLATNPDLRVSIEQAQNYADDDSHVVVASVPTLGNSASNRIERFAKDRFGLIIVDEAHHAAAPSYQRVLEYFDHELLVGFTATPQRGDNVRLTDVFDEVTFYRSIYDMIEAGWLCHPRGYRIPTETTLDGISTSRGDYAVGELEERINVSERNNTIVDAVELLAKDRKTLVFASGVQHASDLCAVFVQRGFRSDVVVGSTASEMRTNIIKAFGEDHLQVVVNVGVLTEGFDEPSVDCVVLARPTRSTLLYTQIVGRGLRLFEGKQDCIVLDMADATVGKRPVGLPTLLGLPPDFDCDGEDLLEVAQKFRDLEAKSPTEASRARSLKDISDSWEQIDLFRPPVMSPVVLEFSRYIWCEVSEGSWYLNVSDNESIHMNADALGRYKVELIDTKAGTSTVLGVAQDIREAFARSDRWIEANRPNNLALLDNQAAWRADAPTPSQIKYLKKFGVPITEDLTKGAASMMLDQLFAANPKPEKPEWLKRKIAAQKAAKRGWG